MVNNASGNGLLPNVTQPLPDQRWLIFREVFWHSPRVYFTGILNISTLDMSLKMNHLRLQPHLSWSNEVIVKFLVGNKNCWSLRCSWSIAYRRCSNYIFILDLTPGFSGLGKGNGQTKRETFKFWESVRFILDVWQYLDCNQHHW